MQSWAKGSCIAEKKKIFAIHKQPLTSLPPTKSPHSMHQKSMGKSMRIKSWVDSCISRMNVNIGSHHIPPTHSIFSCRRPNLSPRRVQQDHEKTPIQTHPTIPSTHFHWPSSRMRRKEGGRERGWREREAESKKGTFNTYNEISNPFNTNTANISIPIICTVHFRQPANFAHPQIHRRMCNLQKPYRNMGIYITAQS